MKVNLRLLSIILGITIIITIQLLAFPDAVFIPLDPPIINYSPFIQQIQKLSFSESAIMFFRGTISSIFGNSNETIIFYTLLLSGIFLTTYRYSAMYILSGKESINKYFVLDIFKSRIKSIDTNILRTEFIILVVSLFSVLNSFILTRVELGHYKVLLGTLLQYWIVGELLSLYFNITKSVKIVIYILLIQSIISPHFLIINMIILPIILIFTLRSSSIVTIIRSANIKLLDIMIFIVLLSVLILERYIDLDIVKQFNLQDLYTWRSRPGYYLDILSNIISLRGYYIDKTFLQSFEVFLKQFSILVPISYITILLMGIDTPKQKNEKIITKYILILFYVGVFLSLGINIPIPFVDKLIEYIFISTPLISLRESTKASSLILISYILSTLTIYKSLLHSFTTRYLLFTAIIIFTIISSTYTFYLSTDQYWQSCNYPYQLKDLNIDSKDKLLILPISLHSYYNFCPSIYTLNPINRYFSNDLYKPSEYSEKEFNMETYTNLKNKPNIIIYLKHNMTDIKLLDQLKSICTNSTEDDYILICRTE